MISTINNNHSIHYNNSKQNKNNIHKSDDKNKIKEKEEKKSNAEIKKNNSQRRIVKNSDENKENKNTENIKKDYKKKKERKSSMENKDNNESKDIKEIPKELSSNKNNITKYNKDNNTNSEENKPIKNAASSIKNKIDTDEEKVKYFDTSKITNVQIPKDYLNIIYYNLLIEEKKGISPMPDHTYMGRQSEINEKMRSILVDWLIDVHFKFGFTDETLFMTVSIIDRYLSVEQITRTNFQLLGITALMIACKHEEIDLPKIDDFIYITDNAYKKNEVIKMEFDVLSKLNFAFLYPSPIKFFEYLSFNFNFEKKQHMMGKYLMESFLLDVKNTKYKPSIISCACAYIVMKFFKMKNYQETYNKKFFVLDETKEKFSEHNIKECAKDICLLVDNINKTNYQACVKKYSKPEQENVAMIIMNN
jgi:cyclin B